MSRSEIQDGCAFGCTIAGKHFAACPSFGAEGETDCPGCHPYPVHPDVADVLVCEWCYRSARGVVQNAPDLLGRMVTMTEQGKAVVYSPVKRSSSGGMVRDVGGDGDLIDAIAAVRLHLRWWDRRVNLRTMNGFDKVLADRDLLGDVRRTVLDHHEEDQDGAQVWSIADAAARWGVERRDRFVYPDAGPSLADRTLSRFADRESTPVLASWPVREWSGHGASSVAFDPLLSTRDAAEAAEVSESQLRKWVAAGKLTHDTTMRDARGVEQKWFYESKVLAVAKEMAADRSSGGRGKPRHRLAK